MDRNALKLLLWMVAVPLAAGEPEPGRDVMLVDEGRSVATIVVAADALPQVHFAARELRDHIAAIAGAELAIVNDPGSADGAIIYVGNSRWTRAMGITARGLAEEGYRVYADGETLVLLGNDANYPAYPEGFTSMGLAYSFYRQPPEDIEVFHPNLGVSYSQRRAYMFTPEDRAAADAERRAWFSRLPSEQFFIWEYFLDQTDRNGKQSQLRGVPVIFFEAMQEDMQNLAGISRGGGFLRPDDVPVYFDILDRAREKAGDTVYGERIDLIIEECQPMQTIFANLTRLGPDFEAPRAAKPEIDGVLDEAIWTDAGGNPTGPVYRARDLHSEEVVEPEMLVQLRWADDDSGLLVGITCMEPDMEALQTPPLPRDSFSIYDSDFTELFIETSDVSSLRIVINPDGAFYDNCTDTTALRANDLATGLDWDSAAEYGVHRHGDRWTVELFIPFDALMTDALPASDAPWGVNVGRSRFIGSKSHNSAISPTHGGFFTVSRFGNLIVEE